MPPPPRGLYTRAQEDDIIPILHVGLFGMLQRWLVRVVGPVDGFDGPDVLLAGGERVPADAVVAATGYRRGPEGLVGHLGVLGPRGRPVVHGAETHPHAPNLHFIGYTNPISGNLRELGIDARRIARTIARNRSPAGTRADAAS
jgi:putative flavoprotein involved in K+ transport